MAQRYQMEIFTKPPLPLPLLTIARQTGDAAFSFLKPGELISAQVQSSSAAGIATLNINDRLLKVASDLQLLQGTKVTLQVELKEGQLVLRLLTPQGDAIETPQQALRQVLPKQQPLQPLFTQLAQLATLTADKSASATHFSEIVSLPENIRQVIVALLKQLPNNEKLATPEGLKQALDNSGIFFESRLSQGAGSASLQGDLKTLLFRIAFLVRQSLESLPPLPNMPIPPSRPLTSPREEGKQAPTSRGDTGTAQTVAAAKQAALISLLQLLGTQSESALARVQMNQLTTLQAQQQGEEPRFILELPLFNGRESEILQLKIQRETRHNNGESETCWSATLNLDNEEYGAIRAVVSLVGAKVSTTFWCEQPQTQQHFQQHLEELRQRMQEQGLELGRTQAFSGRTPQAEAPDTLQTNDNLINTRA